MRFNDRVPKLEKKSGRTIKFYRESVSNVAASTRMCGQVSRGTKSIKQKAAGLDLDRFTLFVS